MVGLESNLASKATIFCSRVDGVREEAQGNSVVFKAKGKSLEVSVSTAGANLGLYAAEASLVTVVEFCASFLGSAL